MISRSITAFLGFGLAGLAIGAGPAWAGEEASDTLAAHGQATLVWQYHPAFSAPYTGANSLSPKAESKETADVTAYLGIRPWSGGELWVDPEVDQGFGLSDTLGVAGFPSGEAYKVGRSSPYVRLQRAFFRQRFALDGAQQRIAADVNQFAGATSADNVVVTVGKFAVTDVFDLNAYAHDPRGDFLNWSVIDSGAFDYAADAWGYSAGAAIEWTQGWWTARTGLFNLSVVPNATTLGADFRQFELVEELEARTAWGSRSGKIRLLGFLNRGRMGRYSDAIAAAQGGVPDTANVRRYRSQSGVAFNVEQELTNSLGAFARASINSGVYEAYEFTEINRSLALGISLKGDAWSRPNDTIGISGVVNGASNAARRYFGAGGLGILIGDGGLNYGAEQIVESYYRFSLSDFASLSADYQYISNPAYNRDRGPVSVIALRLHLQR
jgi:high affinity Mn2+ porin